MTLADKDTVSDLMRYFSFFSQETSWPAWEPGDQPAVQHPVPHQPAPAIGDFVEAEVKGRYRNVSFFAKFLDVDKASGDLKLH